MCDGIYNEWICNGCDTHFRKLDYPSEQELKNALDEHIMTNHGLKYWGER